VAQQTRQGRVIGGRYRLVKALHTGGFGRVWQAHDQHTHDDVAVKEVWLPPQLSAAERAERLVRAEREARNASQLRNHPNIVAVRDVVTEDGLPWIVMRLVTGHSLAEDLAASGPLSAAQVSYLADSLLKALAAAHDAGIVHRDVKPANVMFTENGEILLTDFGIAVHEADTTLTASGMIVGSMEYISPERIRGRDGKAAGDLFSLGVTLYQAVTGVSPFHRDTMAASLAAILFEDPPPPPCPTGLATLIMRLLPKNPLQRPTIPAARALLATLPDRATTTPAQVPTRPATKRPAPVPVPPTPMRPVPITSAPRRPAPTRIAPPPGFAPPRPPRRRPASRVVQQRSRWRRTRRGSGMSIAALIALAFVGTYAAWGRDANGATTGDCVYQHQQGWHLEPCSLPPPWRDTANYKVLQRVDGTPAECATAPGWATGDNAAVLAGMPPVTLCLAPVR
jgi:eukaryotic-like serine/threonine-protein kinase